MPDAGPLLGRERELSVLEQRWSAALGGAGGLVLLGAPAGLGKTRVVQRLANLAGPEATCWGGALDDAGAPPLWPWTRAMRRLPAVRAALEGALVGAGSSVSGEAVAAEFGAHLSVVDALRDAAQQRGGLLVVLEDLHWADLATLRLMERLVSQLADMPLLVVGTHRDSLDVSARLGADSGTMAMDLAPLSPHDASALVRALRPDVAVDAVDELVTLAGGSPLYLTTAALSDTSRWSGGAPALRQLVSSGLARLGDDGEVLRMMSVIGAEAPITLLADVTSLDEAAVTSAATQAASAGLCMASGPEGGPVRFAHALVRDAVYSLLEPRDRALRHRTVAEWLERRSGDYPAALLARQWLRGGDDSRVAWWSRIAAEEATAAGDYPAAIEHLQVAVEREADPAARVDLLLELAAAQQSSGRLPDALGTCELVAERAEREGRPADVVRAALVVHAAQDPSVARRLRSLVARAVDVTATDSALSLVTRARLEAQLAESMRHLEEPGFAEHAAEALVLAMRSGDPGAELDAIQARAAACELASRERERAELGTRAMSLARRTNRPMAELWGCVWRTDAAGLTGDVSVLGEQIEHVGRLAERTRLPLVRWHELRHRASLAALHGEYEVAIAWHRQAQDVAEGLGDSSTVGLGMGFTASVAQVRGRPDDLDPSWETAFGGAPATFAAVRLGRALCLQADGRGGEAADELEAAASALESGATQHTRRMTGMVVPVAVAQGHAQMLNHLERVLVGLIEDGLFTGGATVAWTGAPEGQLAQIALHRGRADEAVDLASRGIRRDLGIGARPYVVLGRLTLARARLARDGSSSAEDALALAREALSDAQSLGMPGPAGEAESLLAELGRTSGSRQHDPLTAREHETVLLVAEGLSNRAIAERLFLSERTVESHVRAARAKLGVTSRTELVRAVLARARP